MKKLISELWPLLCGSIILATAVLVETFVGWSYAIYFYAATVPFYAKGAWSAMKFVEEDES